MTNHRPASSPPADHPTRRASPCPHGLSRARLATAQTSLRESSGAEVHDPVS